jgi:hypothetical protein
MLASSTCKYDSQRTNTLLRYPRLAEDEPGV